MLVQPIVAGEVKEGGDLMRLPCNYLVAVAIRLRETLQILFFRCNPLEVEERK